MVGFRFGETVLNSKIDVEVLRNRIDDASEKKSRIPMRILFRISFHSNVSDYFQILHHFNLRCQKDMPEISKVFSFTPSSFSWPYSLFIKICLFRLWVRAMGLKSLAITL